MVLAAMLMVSGPAYADETIYYQDWLKVKNAVAVLQLPSLQRVISRFEADEDSIIVMHYPGGDKGNAWAIELRDWLVSLGISSDEIQLQPGSGIPQAIVIRTEQGALPR